MQLFNLEMEMEVAYNQSSEYYLGTSAGGC